MRQVLRHVVPLVAVLATGCNPAAIDRLHDGLSGVSDLVGNAYGARALELRYRLPNDAADRPTTFPDVDPAKADAFLGAAVEESQRNCNRFVATIATGRAAKDTAFDIAAIITSGLAAVFVPTLTVRSLAAASSLIQGTNASIDSNFFQQLSVIVFARKIEATYMAEMREFRRRHETGISGSLGIAISDLLDIHRKCSIVYAATQLTDADPRSQGGPARRTLQDGDLTNNALLRDRSDRFWLVAVNGTRYSAVQSDGQGKAVVDGGAFRPTTVARLRQSLDAVGALPFAAASR